MNLQQFVMDINARHYKELEQTVSGLTADNSISSPSRNQQHRLAHLACCRSQE